MIEAATMTKRYMGRFSMERADRMTTGREMIA